MATGFASSYGVINSSFSGTDIVPVFIIPGIDERTKQVTPTMKVFGEIQTLSYSTHRPKTPVRPLGRISPKGFGRGGRTYGGTLVFSVFDRHMIYDLMAVDSIEGLLPDEMPPFNIKIVVRSEYGIRSAMTLYGVEIVDDGAVMSISDILTEEQFSYQCRDIDILMPLGSRGGGVVV